MRSCYPRLPTTAHDCPRGAWQVINLARFEREQQMQLKASRHLKWYLADPDSVAMIVWNVVTAIALGYTAVMTPLEVTLLRLLDVSFSPQ